MVSVPIAATSSGAAPTILDMDAAACSDSSCHCLSGDPSRSVKWPQTPIDDHVSSCASKYLAVGFGCMPREFPQK